jgi:hypothetical protein
MTAVVIPLKLAEPQPRLCIDCDNGALSKFGVYCLAYQEFIEDEKCASECELYDD